jgi:hypothetical protein
VDQPCVSGFTTVSIPHHSQDLNRFTARAILQQLEEDLEALEVDSDAGEEA